jgi:hypothetical protein
MQYSISKILTYQKPEGTIKIDMLLADDTVWLSIPQMAELFGADEREVIALIEDGYSDNGEEDEFIMDLKDQRTFVDTSTNAETVCYNLNIIRYVGFGIDFKMTIPIIRWTAKLLEEEILKNLKDNPDDPQSKNPGVVYLKLITRLKANGIDISLQLPKGPPERICFEISEGVWISNDDEMRAYEKEKKSSNTPIDPTQN